MQLMQLVIIWWTHTAIHIQLYSYYILQFTTPYNTSLDELDQISYFYASIYKQNKNVWKYFYRAGKYFVFGEAGR